MEPLRTPTPEIIRVQTPRTPTPTKVRTPTPTPRTPSPVKVRTATPKVRTPTPALSDSAFVLPGATDVVWKLFCFFFVFSFLIEL